METYVEKKRLVDNPDFSRRREDSLNGLTFDVIDAPIELVGTKIIEIRTPMSVDISDKWVNIFVGANSEIREIKDGTILRIQLVYPDSEERPFSIHLETDGPRVATPQKIYIEKGISFKSGNINYNSIKLTFQ